MIPQTVIKKIVKLQITPRWLIFCIDLGLINIAFFLSVLIRFDFTTLPVQAPGLFNPWLLINAFGVFLFFFIVYDLFFPLGFFLETSSAFVLVPYAKLVLKKIPFFSNSLKKSIYFFPKYRLFNNLLNNLRFVILL